MEGCKAMLRRSKLPYHRLGDPWVSPLEDKISNRLARSCNTKVRVYVSSTCVNIGRSNGTLQTSHGDPCVSLQKHHYSCAFPWFLNGFTRELPHFSSFKTTRKWYPYIHWFVIIVNIKWPIYAHPNSHMSFVTKMTPLQSNSLVNYEDWDGDCCNCLINIP